MDKSFLDITGFTDVFSRFWRQKNPASLRRFAKKSAPFRKPASGFSCPKGCEGRYCMQSIPLAVLKPAPLGFLERRERHCMQSIPLAVLKHRATTPLGGTVIILHAIHTACGIETINSLMSIAGRPSSHCMQSIPLAVLKQFLLGENRAVLLDCMQSIPLAVLKLIMVRTPFLSRKNCMQSIPLAVLKLEHPNRATKCNGHCMQSIPLAVLKQPILRFSMARSKIACNPYRLRY